MTESEFLDAWQKFGFSTDGMPEDAAAFLYSALLTVKDADGTSEGYLEFIGDKDGQQEFVTNSLRAMGLLERDAAPRRARLTTLGERILASLEADVHLAAFCLRD